MSKANNKYDPALTRLSSIMQRLYEGETLNKKELAEEFNVSEKTIQRDLNTRLSNLPIKQIRGIGWKFDDDFIEMIRYADYPDSAPSEIKEFATALHIVKTIVSVNKSSEMYLKIFSDVQSTFIFKYLFLRKSFSAAYCVSLSPINS